MVCVGMAFGVLAVIVLLATVVAVGRWPAVCVGSDPWPSVTILKPLHGLEPQLYAALRSFCVQDYSCYEVVFGVQEATDPAIAVVRRLQAEFPERTIRLVIDSRQWGPNPKVSNLINMFTGVQSDILVLADADICVGTGYLKAIVAPFTDSSVGVVTCLYGGQPVASIWARLGAVFINDWFAPSVLLAHSLGSRSFAFGATLVCRRQALVEAGGFEGLAPYLADDYQLGVLMRARGLRTVLSSYAVVTMVTERHLKALVLHQLRWLRTIRILNPWGYAFSGISFGLPVTILVALWVSTPLMWSFVFLAFVLRIMLHYRMSRRLDIRLSWVLIPLADSLLFVLWGVGFLSKRVQWREQQLAVRVDGSIKVNRE